jgi:hypothetical protein
MNLPPEVWGMITAYFGNDGHALRSLMTASRSTHALLCLPKSVTRLHINVSWKGNTKIEEWPTNWFAKFPSLVSIGLGLGPANQVKISAEVVQTLPRYLRHLHLGFADSISNDMLPLLPPFLETLNLEHNSRINDRGIKDLPESLTSLHLPNNYILSPYCIPFIPKTVTSLSLRTSASITETMMKEMPRLSFLTLSGAEPPSGPAIASLPPTLKTLYWAFNQPIDNLDIALLPEGLQDLTCSLPKVWKALSGGVSSEDCDRCFSSLPRGLLSLTIISSSRVSAKSLASLPPNLRSLELRTETQLEAESLKSLPNSLTQLSLPKHDSLTSSDLMNLPPSLEILKLPNNGHFSNASFAVLPPKLRIFSCLWVNDSLSEACVRYAQPGLSRLELKTRVHNEDGQSIDLAFPTARSIERATGEEFLHRSVCNPWDIHTFALNPAAMTIEQVEIWPKSIPRFNGTLKTKTTLKPKA